MEKKWRNAASPGRGSIMRAALLAAVTAWQAMRGHGSGKRKRTRDSKLPLGLRMNRFLHSLRFWDYRRPICRITRDWLWRKGINFDYLTIERGNVDSPDRIGNVRNRFVICQARKIRMFVEDDLQKARRLADICDVVFLVKHPYNRYIPGDERLPSNVVEVDGWPEIYSFVRHDL